MQLSNADGGGRITYNRYQYNRRLDKNVSLISHFLGKLVEKVIEDTNLKIANKSAVKLHAYSAHELNIAQLLIGLNSFIPPHLPDYSACVIFEIREDKKDDISIAVRLPQFSWDSKGIEF